MNRGRPNRGGEGEGEWETRSGLSSEKGLIQKAPELVQHFAYTSKVHRGSSHRRNGDASRIIYMVWLYRSDVPVWRGGRFTCSNEDYLPSRRLEEGGGEGEEHVRHRVYRVPGFLSSSELAPASECCPSFTFQGGTLAVACGRGGGGSQYLHL